MRNIKMYIFAELLSWLLIAFLFFGILFTKTVTLETDKEWWFLGIVFSYLLHAYAKYSRYKDLKGETDACKTARYPSV